MTMSTLTLSEADVRAWQVFLTKQGFSPGSADGLFGPLTERATREFQSRYGLIADGIPGPHTYAKAAEMGFQPSEPAADALPVAPVNTAANQQLLSISLGSPQATPNWPPKPAGVAPISGLANIERAFGHFVSVDRGGDDIAITNGWDRENIDDRVAIPQLANSRLAPNYASHGYVRFHRRGARQLQALWSAWESAGLLGLVLSFDGAYYPRYKRNVTPHKPENLSNHAWGTAFDINARFNMLGQQPALVGQAGSVRELVELAYRHGFFWGGHFSGRLDGMHFELFSPWD